MSQYKNLRVTKRTNVSYNSVQHYLSITNNGTGLVEVEVDGVSLGTVASGGTLTHTSDFVEFFITPVVDETECLVIVETTDSESEAENVRLSAQMENIANEIENIEIEAALEDYPSINIVDETLAESNLGIDYNGGISAKTGWVLLRSIPVEAETQYNIFHSDNSYIATSVGRLGFLDANKNILSTVDMNTLEDGDSGERIFTTPTDTSYLATNLIVGTKDYTGTLQIEKGDTYTGYSLYALRKSATDYYARDSIEKIDTTTDTADFVANNLYGKKWIMLGDSMVQGHTIGFENTWASRLAVKNNMTIVEEGENGNFLSQEADCMAVRYSTMEDVADYVGVFGGTNDQQDSVPIGTNDDTTIATFKGALNILCSGLITKYPSSKLFFITPYHRVGKSYDYAEAIIDVCSLYSIPVFDNYKDGGISFENSTQNALLTLGDGYHLNSVGMDYALTKYEAFMMAL